MKTITYAFLLLLLPKMAISQVSDTVKSSLSKKDKLIYLDAKLKETKSKDYEYYRIIKDYKLTQENYSIKDYYKTGVLRAEGTYKDIYKLIKEGEVTFYDKKGNKLSVTNYVKNKKQGKATKWYSNGTKKVELEYLASEDEDDDEDDELAYNYKVNQYWDEDGVQKVTDGNGEYLDRHKNFSGEGKVVNGFRDGNWQGWTINSNIKYNENYENGKLISGTTTDEEGVEHKYTALEEKPIPKGGFSEFYLYIAENYRLPNVKNLNGKVYITFFVDVDGKIVDIKVLRDIGYGTGNEAMRVLRESEKWIPGKRRGINTKCKYSIPISVKTNS